MLPALFVSHGAPTLALEGGATGQRLRRLGRELPPPRAILVASAHWETPAPRITAAPTPPTIHDFSGFPAPLYAIRYDAPGDPALAEHIVDVLGDAGFEAAVDPARGLDHGAWVPLVLMYPRADIPVLQVSLSPAVGAAHHLALGAALAPLREQSVLILGSGGATHNLAALRGQSVDVPPPPWVTEFNAWLADAVVRGDTDALVGYREAHPQAALNHPTEEHYLPLLLAAGAGGGGGERIHQGYSYGVLSMDAYRFG